MRCPDRGRLPASARPLGRALALAGSALLLAGCNSSGSNEGFGSTMLNALAFSGTTPPPVQRVVGREAAECPAVAVIPGRSAIRNGEGDSLRSQVAISNVARECLDGPGGSIVVKVGVEGRALLGPAGGASAKFDVPVTFVIRRGDAVLTSRTRRASVSIGSGEGQAAFVVVEGDMVVPPGAGEYEIEVGLGAGGAAAPAGRRRRRG